MNDGGEDMSLHSRPRIRRRDSLLVEFLATKTGAAARTASRNELRALAEENDAAVQEARTEAALYSADTAEKLGESVSLKSERVLMAKRHLGSERQRALSAKRKKLRAERKRNGAVAGASGPGENFIGGRSSGGASRSEGGFGGGADV